MTQKHIPPGETYVYEFTLKQHGVQMYHPHSDEMIQMALGMQGFFVIHPKGGYPAPVDRHFCIFLQEWFVEPGTFTPNPSIMTDFNLFTFNSRVFPGILAVSICRTHMAGKTTKLLKSYRILSAVLLVLLAGLPLIFRRNFVFATSATTVVIANAVRLLRTKA